MIRSFTHDGLVISVETSEDDLAWLTDFMTPAFATGPATAADVYVSFAPGPDLGGRTPDPHGPIAFALDSGPVRLPAWSLGEGLRLADTTARVWFDVSQDGRRVHIAYHADRLDARVRLMRVVREYAHNHSIHTGGVMLHAAAVTLEGSAVAIVGRKGSGKTTMTMRLLEVPGTSYLSNDRVMVRLGQSPRAIGVPTIITVRIGTRIRLPDVAARLQHTDDCRYNAQEAAALDHRARDMTDDSWWVAPQQLCHAMNRPLQDAAGLVSVLFLHSAEARNQPLERLSTSEAAAALREAVLCCEHGHSTSQVFRTSDINLPDQAELHARCHTLASRVVCVRGALSDAASVEDAKALLQTCIAAAL